MTARFGITHLLLIIISGFVSVSGSVNPRDVIGAASPCVTPDGNNLIFGYQGDIWTVRRDENTARRLTVNSADDNSPVISPDGKWVAFNSNRNGNFDIYIMSITGGVPRRLTYNSVEEMVTAFSPDSRFVIFMALRDWRRFRICKVSITGGQPVELSREEAGYGSISPDGRYLLMTIGYVESTRVGYHGPGNSDLWIRDLQADTLRQITRYDGVDRSPVWGKDGNSMYFISDRETGVFNIWKVDFAGKQFTRITHFTDGNIFDCSLAPDGSELWFIRNGKIHHCTMDGRSAIFPVQTAADTQDNMLEHVSFSSGIDEMALSKDEKQFAFIHHGDLFAMPVTGGKAVNLTETPARESDPQWSEDSKSIYFLSDRTGIPSIYLTHSIDPESQQLSKSKYRETKEIVSAEYPISAFCVSPDEQHIVFTVDTQGLFICDVTGENRKQLSDNAFIDGMTFSPDSRSLAYYQIVHGWNQDIMLLDIQTGEIHDVSLMEGDEYLPFFSADGKRLFFTASFQRNSDIYAVWLRRADAEKYPDEDAEATAESDDKKKEDAKNKAQTPPSEIQIDYQDIYKRVKKLFGTAAEEKNAAVSPDGKTIAFNSNALNKWEIYTSREKELKKCASKNVKWLKWSDDGAKIYYLSNDGSPGFIEAASGSDRPIAFSAKMTINHPEEYKQMYREAWNAMNTSFYDKNFHGKDWSEIYEKYYPLVEHARTTREFHHAVRLMIGELNASHVGIWKNDSKDSVKTGYIGVRLGKFVPGLGYEISDVIPDSPADRVGSRLHTGEFLHAVNRVPVMQESNLSKMFNDTVGEMTDIEVLGADGKHAARTVSLKPVDFGKYRQLAYEQWVDGNRKTVDRLSGGAIGYVHIQSMTDSCLKRFRREVFSLNISKEALIIDVRYNPGGYIHNKLVKLLVGDSFGYSVPRGGEPLHHPPFVWRKPNALLINQKSFSDAEVFPNAYQTLGIGTVIGTPTYGGVIGTGGINLLDGSWFRVPFVGWFTRDGRDMENSGAQPDIIVTRAPTEFQEGKDTQLEKAVAFLMTKIESEQRDTAETLDR